MTDNNKNVVPGICMPVLINRFSAQFHSDQLADESFDYFTAQIISLEVIKSPITSNFGIYDPNIIKLIIEVDTSGGVIAEYNKIKDINFNINIDNLAGNNTIFHTEKYKNCIITNTSWSHDYTYSHSLRLIMDIACESIDFELVSPTAYNPVNYDPSSPLTLDTEKFIKEYINDEKGSTIRKSVIST